MLRLKIVLAETERVREREGDEPCWVFLRVEVSRVRVETESRRWCFASGVARCYWQSHGVHVGRGHRGVVTWPTNNASHHHAVVYILDKTRTKFSSAKSRYKLYNYQCRRYSMGRSWLQDPPPWLKPWSPPCLALRIALLR